MSTVKGPLIRLILTVAHMSTSVTSFLDWALFVRFSLRLLGRGLCPEMLAWSGAFRRGPSSFHVRSLRAAFSKGGPFLLRTPPFPLACAVVPPTFVFMFGLLRGRPKQDNNLCRPPFPFTQRNSCWTSHPAMSQLMARRFHVVCTLPKARRYNGRP